MMNTLTQLLDADTRYRRASAEAQKALRTHFVCGDFVCWTHGRQIRSGTVVEVVGSCYHHARIIVRSTVSGKHVVIDAQRILDAQPS